MEDKIKELRTWLDILELNVKELRTQLDYYEKWGVDDPTDVGNMARMSTRYSKDVIVENAKIVSKKFNDLLKEA